MPGQLCRRVSQARLRLTLPGPGSSLGYPASPSRVLRSRFSSLRLSRATAVLTSVPFMAAVGVLVVNDWVLKAAFGNWVTGKLSDVAGLAAFSMFAAALLPRHVRAVFVATAVAFVVWKSPLSDQALEAWNALGLLPLARVKDYSDVLALGVLVPTYRLMQRLREHHWRQYASFARRMGAVAAGIVGIIAFTATSILRPIPIETTAYPVAGSRDEVLAGLDSIGVPIAERSKSRAASSADTLAVRFRHPPERWVALTIEIIDTRPGEAQIRPVALWPHGPPQPTMELLMRAFAAQVVQPLEQWLALRRSEGR